MAAMRAARCQRLNVELLQKNAQPNCHIGDGMPAHRQGARWPGGRPEHWSFRCERAPVFGPFPPPAILSPQVRPASRVLDVLLQLSPQRFPVHAREVLTLALVFIIAL